MTQPLTTHRERTRLATRNEILQTARQQIAKEGASALSLRAIAREMGLTAPALYRYFQNRDDLVTTLIVDAYTSLGDALETARNSNAATTHKMRLQAMMLAYRDWGLAHPQDYALIFGTPIPGYQAPIAITSPAASRAMGVLAAEIAEALATAVAIPAPEYAQPSPAILIQMNRWRTEYSYAAPAIALHLALVSWTRLHGLVSLELFNQISASADDPGVIYHSEVQVLLREIGFLAPTSS